MKTKKFTCIAFLFSTLVACGGSDSDRASNDPPSNPPPPPAAPVRGGDLQISQLSGSWFGTLEAVPVGGGTRQMQRLNVTISGNTIVIDDLEGVPSDLTGTITKQGPQLFQFSVNNQQGTRPSRGILFVDSSANYLLFLNQFSDIGIVRKGAPVLPPFANDALNGSWSGVTLTMDASGADFTNFAADDSNTTCSGLTCTGRRSSNINRTATYSADSVTPSRGRWIGTYTDTSGARGETRALLSPDQVFAVTWACETGGSFPSDCDFSAWRRQ